MKTRSITITTVIQVLVMQLLIVLEVVQTQYKHYIQTNHRNRAEYIRVIVKIV